MGQITSEKQAKITRKWILRFLMAVADLDEQPPTAHPMLIQAIRDGYVSQIEILCAELRDWEAKRERQTD